MFLGLASKASLKSSKKCMVANIKTKTPYCCIPVKQRSDGDFSHCNICGDDYDTHDKSNTVEHKHVNHEITIDRFIKLAMTDSTSVPRIVFCGMPECGAVGSRAARLWRRSGAGFKGAKHRCGPDSNYSREPYTRSSELRARSCPDLSKGPAQMSAW